MQALKAASMEQLTQKFAQMVVTLMAHKLRLLAGMATLDNATQALVAVLTEATTQIFADLPTVVIAPTVSAPME